MGSWLSDNTKGDPAMVDNLAGSPERDSIGARIAAARKLHRMTQTELARRAAVSYSLLTKVETGARAATPALVGAVARALGVSTAKLQGQPYAAHPDRNGRLVAAVEPLRRVLYAHDLEPDDEAPVRDLDTLAGEVNRALQLRQDYRLSQLGELLPGLLDELTTAAYRAESGNRERAYRLLAMGYRAARSIPYRLGHADLVVLADRCFAWAATRSGDPLLAGPVADWLRVDGFFQVGHYDAGLRLVAATLRRLEPDTRRDDVPTLSVYGSMHLRAAILAARAGKASVAREHLAEAAEVAGRAGPDNNLYQLAFGPANVAVHATAAEVELGNAPEAIQAGEGLRLPDTMPAERSSHHHLDMGRAWMWHGDRKKAVDALLTAERLAPQQTRYHPMARETVRMLVRLERQSSNNLIGLASRLGVEV